MQSYNTIMQHTYQVHPVLIGLISDNENIYFIISRHIELFFINIVCQSSCTYIVNMCSSLDIQHIVLVYWFIGFIFIRKI